MASTQTVTFDIGPQTTFLPSSYHSHHDVDPLASSKLEPKQNDGAERRPSSVPTTRAARPSRGYKCIENDKDSKRAQKLRRVCNVTTLAIAACLVLAFLALTLSIFNIYMYNKTHGFGPSSPTSLSSSSSTPSMDSGRRIEASSSQSDPKMFGTPRSRPPVYSGRGENSTRAFAHIVGNGDRVGVNDEDLDRLISWRNNVSHNVEFESAPGVVRILEPGFYYVYSQVYFLDSSDSAMDIDVETGKELPMVFSTIKNNAPLMESVLTFTRFSTKYHGGSFHLGRGDAIGVRVSNGQLRIGLSAERTYFGVIMLAAAQSL